MLIIKVLFWICLFGVLYVYIGYPIALLIFKILFIKKVKPLKSDSYYPTVTLFITAFNEADFVDIKVKNSFDLDYPKDKLEYIWVTDGSNDKTNELLAKYSEIKVYYEPERRGKINAMNRGMDFVTSEIVVFSDGNTILNSNAIREIVLLFNDTNVGCVAGEKRIVLSSKDEAASSGEGMYWKYESWIKKLDSQVGTCVGAAGELFAIRKHLFFKVPDDTILDDFIISLTIASKGYKVAYSSNAYAIEKASANVNEEMKRKIRIAAGSFQATLRLKTLLNPFKFGMLSFQFISHKILRWIMVPVSLVMLFVTNLLILIPNDLQNNSIYMLILAGQFIFYLMVLLGFVFRKRRISIPAFFVPYYFFVGNYAMFQGFARFLKGNQSVNWERAERAT